MIIDLCCGLGRFEREGEEVISIDIQRKVKPTIVADIRHLPLRPGLKPDLCHASPPCKYFSIVRMPQYGWDAKGIGESLNLVAACFDAFDYLEAKTWTLENPVGFLGKIFNQSKITYKAHDMPKKATNFWSNNRSLKRAVIPRDVRERLMDEFLPTH